MASLSPPIEAFEHGKPTTIKIVDYAAQKITLQAPADKKIVLEEIFVDGAKYVDVMIQTRLIGRFPVALGDCLFVPKPGTCAPSYGFLNVLREIFGPYYITAYPDEQIILQFDQTPTKVVLVYYEIPENQTIGQELRGLEDFRLYFALITHSAAISSSGQYSLDTPVQPIGDLELKDGIRMPTGWRLQLKILAFASASNGGTKPTYLHIYVGDQKLLVPSPDKAVLVDPSYNMLKFDILSRLGFILEEDYEIVPGQKLTLKFDAVYDGTNTLAAQSCYLIMGGILRRT